MALNSNLVEEEDIRNLGFKTALFIDVPNWTKDKNTGKFINEVVSAGNTPDQTNLNEFNKSLVSNLISQDLMKKLEGESPSKFDYTSIDDYLVNQYFFNRKLSFEEENEEDTETKVSKQRTISKDSNSSFEKKNERKCNSLHILQNPKEEGINFYKKYPSSMDNQQQCLKSKEEQDFNLNTKNNYENNNSNSKFI